MDFEQIEDKIIDEIKSALTYVRTIETYAGQLEADIEKLPVNFPAVYVVYAGSALDWVDALNFSEAAEFSVLVCAKDVRGHKEARKGTAGCYQMIRDVLSALTNNSLGLDIEKMQPVRAALVYITKSTAVYGIDFKTNFDNTYE